MAQDKDPHPLGAQPIEAQHIDNMTAVVEGLDQLFNGKMGGPGRTTGFILMVFPFNDAAGRVNYASNGADRKDVIRLFEEQITRFRAEGAGDDDAPMIEAMATAIG